jgi:hypothetical protein
VKPLTTSFAGVDTEVMATVTSGGGGGGPASTGGGPASGGCSCATGAVSGAAFFGSSLPLHPTTMNTATIAQQTFRMGETLSRAGHAKWLLVGVGARSGPEVERLLRAEAQEANAMSSFAKSSLVRRLHERVAQGWGVGDDFEFRSASAYASWNGGLLDEDAEAAWTVWNRLCSADLPEGWLPSGVDDAILDAAFDQVAFGCSERQD